MPSPRHLLLPLALLGTSCGLGGGGGSSNKPPGNDEQDEPPFQLDFPAVVQTPAEPTGCAQADLDGDGRLDVLVATRQGDLVAYLGGEDGFTAQPMIALGGELGRPVAADLNADGDMDVALPLFDSKELVVLLGRGDGTFDAPQKTAVDSVPRQLDVEDLDGNGTLDLLVRRDAPDALETWFGIGNGTFKLGPALALEAATIELARGDWSGDGRRDVAVSVTSGSARVRVLVAQGDGSFVDGGSIEGLGSPGRLAGADLNANGKDDLVVTDAQAGTVRTYLGDGDVGFTLVDVVDVGSYAHDLTVADLDGDGSQDVLVATGVFGQVVALRGTGTGALNLDSVHDLPELPLALASGDWTGDGAPDLLAVDFLLGRMLAIENDGAGRLRAPENLLFGVAVSDVEALDWSGDGLVDLALADEEWNTLRLLRASAGGEFVEEATLDFPGALLALDSGDVNGDGRADILVVPQDDPPRLALLLADAFGGFAAPVDLPLGLSTPADVAVADVNGDGELDVLATTGFEGLFVLPGNGDGTFDPPLNTETGEGPGGPLTVADFNGDKIPDVAAATLFSADAGLGRLHVLFGDGTGTYPTSLELTIPEQATAVLAPDLDGDGQADLAVACRGNAATSRGLILFTATGTGVFDDAGTALEDLPVESLAVRDLDGNGAPDLVAGVGGSGEIVVLLRTQGGELEEPRSWHPGFTPRGFSCRDVDGDGRIDVVAAGSRVTLLRQR